MKVEYCTGKHLQIGTAPLMGTTAPFVRMCNARTRFREAEHSDASHIHVEEIVEGGKILGIGAHAETANFLREAKGWRITQRGGGLAI